MENASKALLMAAGVLIGVLILALMVALFATSDNLFTAYEAEKKAESIQQFNVNFTQFVGRKLTIHEVITICNFARENNVTPTKVGDFNIDEEVILDQIFKDTQDAEAYYNDNHSGENVKIEVVYEMQITGYNSGGYVSSIKFKNRSFIPKNL